MLLILFISYVVSAYAGVRLKRSMLEAVPCLDAELVEKSDVRLPARLDNLPLLWKGRNTKFFKSDGLQYQWALAKSLPIKGLVPETTIGDVVIWLDEKNCSVFVVDETVRQLVFRKSPVSLKMGVSCSLYNLITQCEDKFGTACGLYKNDEMDWVEIGDARVNASIDKVRAEPLVIASIESRISKRETRFSANSMLVFEDVRGRTLIFDASGRGFNDLCERRISPFDSGNPLRSRSFKRLLQFFELRWSGFSAATHLQEDVSLYFKSQYSTKLLQRFYCENLLYGVLQWSDTSTVTCSCVYPNYDHRRIINKARRTMSDDLGHFWIDQVLPDIEKIEAVYLTDRKMADMREIVYQRKPFKQSVDVLRYIEHGKPIVEDISDVHRRPIMSMGANYYSFLPKDYPSAPHGKPDGNGSFVEAATTNRHSIVMELESTLHKIEKDTEYEQHSYDYRLDRSEKLLEENGFHEIKYFVFCCSLVAAFLL